MATRYSFEPPPVKLADLLRDVKKYRTQDLLVHCNRFARWAEEKNRQNPASAYVDVPYLSYGVPAVGRVHITGADLAGLARMGLLYSSDRRQGSLTPRAFINLVSAHANLDDPFSRSEVNNIDDAYSFLLRTAWNQFPYQESPSRLIPRHLLMLEEGNAALKGQPLDVLHEWRSLSGMDLRRFMEVGFAFASGARHHEFIERYFASSGILDGKISPEECDAFLRLVATDYRGARSLAKAFDGPNQDYECYAFNVLIQRPLIEIDGKLIAPLPNLVFKRFTSGVVFDLVDAFKDDAHHRNPFSEALGILFENYVGRLLSWAFGEQYVIHEPEYGKPIKRGPDWVVLDGDTALLFECRTSRLSLESKTVGEMGSVVKDMERMFLQTMERFPEKVRDIAQGRTSVDPRGIKSYEQIVVMSEPDYVEPILRQWGVNAVSSSDEGPISLIDVADVETMSAWHSTLPMQELLRQWRARYQTEPMEFGLFLGDWARGHNLNAEHPLLGAVQDDFVSRLVGQDIQALQLNAQL